MSEFHLAYIEMETLHDWGKGVLNVPVADAQVIAVLCRNCQVPPSGLLVAYEEGEDGSRTSQPILQPQDIASR